MSGVTNKPELSEPPLPSEDFNQPSSSKGCYTGCLGCLGAAVLLGLISVSFSYYAILYTSLPLNMVARLIESNPGVKIHGLSGTLSSGFHIEEITYQSDSLDELSKIEDVEFRFNGIGSLFSEDRRLIIEEFSVASGTFYFRSKDEPKSSSSKPSDKTEKNAKRSEKTNRSNDAKDLFKEIRIDLVEFSKIKFIDVTNKKTSRLKDAKMENFHFLDGKIREVGKYSIDGLTIELNDFEMQNFNGNPADGFSIDRIRVRNRLEQWSDVQNIQFQFNGSEDLINNNQLVIDRLSVDSGVFYFTPSDWNSLDAPEFDEISDTDFEGTHLQSMKIKEISFPNLRFINTDTDFELNIQKLSWSDLEWKDGLLVELGEFVLKANKIQLSSGPSDSFPDQSAAALKREFIGTVDAGVHPNLLQKVKFQLDICFLSVEETLVQMEMCDGQIKYTSDKDTCVITLANFQRDDWLAELNALTPVELNGKIVTTRKPLQTDEMLQMDGTLKFGEVEFEVNAADIPITEDAKHVGPIPLLAAASPKELKGQLYLLNEYPFTVLKLQNEKQSLTDKESFAEALWGVAFADLNKQKQQQIIENLSSFDKLTSPETETPQNPKTDN